MVQRQSTLFLPTLREDPADAEAVSHKLLVRAGLIRQVGAGLWTYLPAGWRVHENVAQIVREEMNAIGGQEMSMPVLTPAELWQLSGRYDKFDSLMKLRDASEREFVLAATHEETVTFHARELRSYRDLPKILYHFQTKEREEARPRGGLLRVREFVMKDAYSFDRDEAGLDRSFLAQKGAYERIFERCGVETVAVQAESGMMGGSESVDFLAPSGSGENTLVTCENGDYAADLEITHGVPRPPEFPEALAEPAEVETPDVTTCEALAAFLGIDLAATSKAMPVVADGKVVLALVRGDDRLDEAKLVSVLGTIVRPAQVDEIRGGVRSGARLARPRALRRVRWSSTKPCARGSSSPERTGPATTCAAWNVGGTSTGGSRTSGSRARATDVPAAAARSPFARRSKWGTSSSSGRSTPFRSMRRTSTSSRSSTRSRWAVTASAPAGCLPRSSSRATTIAALSGRPRSRRTMRTCCRSQGDPTRSRPWRAGVAEDLSGSGRDVLLDDRDARPGEKFADADLLGCPLRVTVGKKSLDDGSVDVRRRSETEDTRVSRASVIDWTMED